MRPRVGGRRRAAPALTLAVGLLAGCTPSGGPTLPAGAPQPTSAGSITPNFSLLVHCGVDYATFDGHGWRAVPPIPTIPSEVTDPGGGGHNRSSVSGRMVRTSETEAVFTSTEEPVGATVRFRVWTGEIPGCA